MTVSGKRTMLLVYHFPQNCGLSWMLREKGFVHWDGSTWFALESQAPAVPVEAWRAAGARVELLPFVPEQYEFVRQRALEHLEREAGMVRKGIDVTVARARDLLETAEREQSVNGVKRATKLARFTLWRLRRQVRCAAGAALMFDLLNESGPLFEAVRTALATEEEEWYVRFARLKEAQEVAA